MKKNISLILVLVLTLSFISGCSSENKDKEVTIESIKSKGKLVVGTSADFPPNEFHMLVDGKDTIVGSDIELAKYIAGKLEVELEIKDMDFNNLLNALSTGMVDLVIAGMAESPERKANFTTSYDPSGSHCMLIRKTDEAKFNSTEDFFDLKVGAQISSLQADFAMEIDGAEVIELPTLNNLILQLKTDKVDGVVMSQETADSYTQTNDDLIIASGIEFTSDKEGAAVAIKEGNDKLTEEINEIIEEVLEKGLYEEWKKEYKELSDKEIE